MFENAEHAVNRVEAGFGHSVDDQCFPFSPYLWTSGVANDKGTLDVKAVFVWELECWESCVQDPLFVVTCGSSKVGLLLPLMLSLFG